MLKASVLLSVFAIGLRASVHDATYLFRKTRELVRAVLAMNVLMPLFAVVLVSMFDLTPAAKIALVALSVSPIPPLLPNRMVKAGSTNSYAIGLLIAVGLLAIIRATRDGDNRVEVQGNTLRLYANDRLILVFASK